MVQSAANLLVASVRHTIILCALRLTSPYIRGSSPKDATERKKAGRSCLERPAYIFLVELPFLLFVEALKLIVMGQLLQQGLHSLVQGTALCVIRLKYPVHTLVLE